MIDEPHLPYPADTEWRWKFRETGFEHSGRLLLEYQVEGTSIGEHDDPEAVSATDLWRRWVGGLSGSGVVRIRWGVCGQVSEHAPWLGDALTEDNFLHFFTWPTRADTGARLNWMRLPVQDQRWTSGQADAGGFLQELTGWKPSPFQESLDLRVVAEAAGLWLPSGLGTDEHAAEV